MVRFGYCKRKDAQYNELYPFCVCDELQVGYHSGHNEFSMEFAEKGVVVIVDDTACYIVYKVFLELFEVETNDKQ